MPRSFLNIFCAKNGRREHPSVGEMVRGVRFSRITGVLQAENYAGTRYCRAEKIGRRRVTAWTENVGELRCGPSTLPFLLPEENVGGAHLKERRQ